MGTPLEKVYSAFLSKMLEDEWLNWTQEEVEELVAKKKTY